MKTQKKTQILPTVSKVLRSGEILELLYKPESGKTVFCHWDGTTYKEANDYLLPGGMKLIPYSAANNLIAHNVILFPSEPLAYESQETLIDEITTFIRRYVDLSEGFTQIAAYYVLFTWIHDQFNELPYLRVRGDYGSGKTRFLLTVGSLCYKPIFASGASTVSPIFHILDSFGGTLLVDEADFRFSDAKSDIVKILNNGNVRGFPVLRSEQSQTKEFNPKAFHVYGPKLVATRGYYQDRALESRFITEELGRRPLRKDIPINLPSEYQHEALILRNKLLLYRFHSLQNKQINADLIDPRLEPRLNQIFTPLASVMDDSRIQENLRLLATRYQEDIVADRSMDIEAQVLQVIAEYDSSKTPLYVKVLADRFIERFGVEYDRRITPKWIGSIVRRNLKLRTYKSNGSYAVHLDDSALLARLYERYGVHTTDNET
ncbi:MAG: hypothetical protein KZQ99_03520 [Candidatus Thiodiazotropha sp. (ex Dulcina madagascariensis)]|nr:hypothetical protein [Candidatus Thiodiazotropha sp. (ex Dulcina madagascariensis)]